MSILPNRLKITEGHLEMIDGSDVVEYLRQSPITDGVDVVVMNREHAERMRQDADAYRMIMNGCFTLAA